MSPKCLFKTLIPSPYRLYRLFRLKKQLTRFRFLNSRDVLTCEMMCLTRIIGRRRFIEIDEWISFLCLCIFSSNAVATFLIGTFKGGFTRF